MSTTAALDATAEVVFGIPPKPDQPTDEQPLVGEARLLEMAEAAEERAVELDKDAALMHQQAEVIEGRAVDARRHAQAYRLALEYLRSGR